jgi:hypothetical protein
LVLTKHAPEAPEPGLDLLAKLRRRYGDVGNG